MDVEVGCCHPADRPRASPCTSTWDQGAIIMAWRDKAQRPWAAAGDALEDVVESTAGMRLGARDSLADGYEHDAPGAGRGAPGDAWEQTLLGDAGGPQAPDASTPVFRLARVQYAFSAPVAQLCVRANKMVVFLRSGVSRAGDTTFATPAKLVCIDLDDPQHAAEALVTAPGRAPRRGAPDAPRAPELHRMFVDASAEHVLLSLRTGELLYWTPGWACAQPVPRLAGVRVESAAWGTDAAEARSMLPPPSAHRHWRTTGSVLLGTEDGALLELVLDAQVPDAGAGSAPGKSEFFDRLARRAGGSGSAPSESVTERLVHHAFLFDERQPVTGVHVERIADSRSALVLASTPTRIYEFAGELGAPGGSRFAPLFRPYRDELLVHLKTELPGGVDHSALAVRGVAPLAHAEPPRVAVDWTTSAGVFDAQLVCRAASSGESVLEQADVLPYPGGGCGSSSESEAPAAAPASAPLTALRTDFHVVLVYADRVCCLHALDGHLAYEEPVPDGPVLGGDLDAATGTCWVYTARSIFELVLGEEDRDVWRIYLERRNYDAAERYAKTAAQRGTVLEQQGEQHLAQGKDMLAAQCFAQTTQRSFESIALAFLQRDAQDALRCFVTLRLERTPKTQRVQRLMLATWLVEMHLSKLNQLEDLAATQAASGEVATYQTEQRLLSEDLVHLFRTYRSALDPDTTLNLISRHGRADMWFHFAEIVGDQRRVVRRLVREQRWHDAIDAINRQCSLEVYYTFAAPLLRHAPAETVEAWRRQPALDPRKLIPALLQYRAPPPPEPHHAIAYLEHVVLEQGSTDRAVGNLLVTLLAERAAAAPHDEQVLAALFRFIEAGEQAVPPRFDLNYALRLCTRRGLRDACVRLHARMDQFGSAVDLALEADDIELACRCVERASSKGDAALSKALWLQCAQHVVHTQRDMHAVIAFLQRTDLLTIEDVLPFFPDFTVIDEFKAEICDTLESYVARIDALKEEMDATTHTAEHIQQDIQQLSKRFVLVEPDQLCSKCTQPLMQRHLYIFPCRHGFHADCLVTEVTRHLPPGLLRRLLQLQEELSALVQPAAASAGAGGSADPAAAEPSVVSAALSSTAKVGASVASGFGSTLKLDRLREHVRPEAIVEAISTGLNMGMASGRRVLAPLDPFVEPRVRAAGEPLGKAGTGLPARAPEAPPPRPAADAAAAARIDALRDELNAIVAGACPTCALSVQQLTQPFVSADEAAGDAAGDWAV